MSFKELSIMSDKKGTVLFYPYIPAKSLKILKKTLSTRWIGQGPMVDKFEKKFSDIFLKGKECVSTGSGTDALHLAYLLAGIKKGDEVILYSYHDNTNVVHFYFFHLFYSFTTRKT